MQLNKTLRLACDGESGSGKSTAAKAVSLKYRLFCMNSGLLFRFASYLIIKQKPTPCGHITRLRIRGIQVIQLFGRIVQNIL